MAANTDGSFFFPLGLDRLTPPGLKKKKKKEREREIMPKKFSGEEQVSIWTHKRKIIWNMQNQIKS